jgi:hypothetical protein
VLVDGGFLNATLKAILNVCAPNDRKVPLHLHVDLALNMGKIYAPAQIAAVSWAIEVVTQDPQLLPGFIPEITFDAFHSGGGGNGDADGTQKEQDLVTASVAMSRIARRGLNKTNVMLGPDMEYSIIPIARGVNEFGVGAIVVSTTIYVSNPLNKPKFPYVCGALASGMKILNIFAAILDTFKWKAMLMIAPEGDSTFGALNPILTKQGYALTAVEYGVYKQGLKQTAEKREKFKQVRERAGECAVTSVP